MKLVTNRTVGEIEPGGGAGDISGGGGKVVVVGVKLDSQSRELLTWALVKVAQSGDRVIALHVLSPSTEGKSTLISLVKTLDSVLAAYEGFCNLKQVDLKLKVCRGTSARKILVHEVNSFGSANLVVGISRAQHTIRSPLTVAKYCAWNLSKKFTVLAVDNGKILFQREASRIVCHSQANNDQSEHSVRSIHRSVSKKRKGLHKATIDSPLSKSNQSISLNGNVDNSMALVPVKTRELTESQPGWALIRRMFLHKRKQAEGASGKKTSVMQWLLRSPSRQSLAAIYPDQKQCVSHKDECHLLKEDIENGTVTSEFCLKGVPKELEGLHEKYVSKCRLFHYHELLLATSNFIPENMVGEGGSSQVYRGCLPDGKEVAVKILKPSVDVLKQFLSEIEILTTLSYKNIISLFGFCFEDNHLLLVYNFVSHGSLEENLHGYKKNRSAISWEDRYKVALGIAEALDYLHNLAVEPILHRDVKASNILLTDDFEPQLSDFGLAMPASSSCHMTCTDVAGTFGYLAPEYFMHGKVNDKSDVYAYGVVLLELLSGRRPIENDCPKDQQSLVMWAKPILKGEKVSEMLDSSLGSDYNPNQIERMVLAATLCIKPAPQHRPQISTVLKLLRGDLEVIEWARQHVNDVEEPNALDDEAFPTNIRSHLNLAFQDLDDDALSVSSTEQIVSLDDYLQGRWSRSSSFD